jgi:hypothetical protein
MLHETDMKAYASNKRSSLPKDTKWAQMLLEADILEIVNVYWSLEEDHTK